MSTTTAAGAGQGTLSQPGVASTRHNSVPRPRAWVRPRLLREGVVMAGLGASSRSVFRRCRSLAAAAVTSALVGGVVAGGAPTMVAAQAAACGTVIAGGLNSPRFVAV